MEIERTCMLFVSWYKFVSIFLAFKHKETETEAKKKVFLSFGNLTRKPQSYLLEAFYVYNVHWPKYASALAKIMQKQLFFFFLFKQYSNKKFAPRVTKTHRGGLLRVYAHFIIGVRQWKERTNHKESTCRQVAQMYTYSVTWNRLESKINVWTSKNKALFSS